MIHEEGEGGNAAVSQVKLHSRDTLKIALAFFAAVLTGGATTWAVASYIFTPRQEHNTDIHLMEMKIEERKADSAKHEAVEAVEKTQLTSTLTTIGDSLKEQNQAIQSLHTNQTILMRELGTRRPAPLPARMRASPP